LPAKRSQNKSSDLQTIGRILQRIHELQEKHWLEGKDLRGKKLPKASRDNYDYFASSFCQPIALRSLDGLIVESVTRHKSLEVENLLMPPLDLDKKFIPVLSLECHPGTKTSPFSMRICVGMFSFVQNRQPVLFGIRFESAHFNSNHNFCHGQFTREFEYNSHKLDGAGAPKRIQIKSLPDWMPKHIPCVMVPAENPVSLVLCMLISFYGDRVRNNISDLDISRKDLEVLAYLTKKK
jgi:hypothetical protein